MPLDVDQLVRVYIKIRDARAANTREYEAEDSRLKQQQEKIESVLLAHLNETNSNSVQTPSGTFFRQEEVIPSASDWGAFHAWMREQNAMDALERRVKRVFITEYMDANEGRLPPGISVFRRFACRVRKPS